MNFVNGESLYLFSIWQILRECWWRTKIRAVDFKICSALTKFTPMNTESFLFLQNCLWACKPEQFTPNQFAYDKYFHHKLSVALLASNSFRVPGINEFSHYSICNRKISLWYVSYGSWYIWLHMLLLKSEDFSFVDTFCRELNCCSSYWYIVIILRFKSSLLSRHNQPVVASHHLPYLGSSKLLVALGC